MFYLIEKLATAARAKTRERLESAVDSQALSILGQEIYDCEANLRQAKQHLAQVMADKVKMQRQLELYKAKLVEKEALIQRYLAQNDEQNAAVIANALVDQEALIAQQQQQCEQLQQYENRLLANLKTTTNQLEMYRAQLHMARTTQHAQQAVGKLAKHSNCHSDAFEKMQDSVTRLQAKQSAFDDQMQAMQQIDSYMEQGTTLNLAKLEKQDKVNAVLARLRSQSH